MDQTPLPFEFLDGRTYDFKGRKTVWVKSARSGWEKRQATLMVYISADGIARCKPLIIFHGSEGKKTKPIRDEMLKYDQGVKVVWNKEAWANEKVMIQWLRDQWAYATDKPSLTVDRKRHRLLTLDVFTGQKTDEVKKVFKELNCTTSFIPPGCTGFVQPLDVAINKPLKNRIKELSEIHYDNYMEEWENHKYTVGERRILVTHWVGQAWREFHKDKKSKELIVKTFEKLGLSLAVDGSQDEKLHVKDMPDIQVGDWTRQEEVLLDVITTVNDDGDDVVPPADVVDNDPAYCMDYENEEEVHDSELDAEGEGDEDYWIKPIQ
jgi:hypothetical protein